MDTNKPQPEKEPPEAQLDRKIAQARKHAQALNTPKSQEEALERLDEHQA